MKLTMDCEQRWLIKHEIAYESAFVQLCVSMCTVMREHVYSYAPACVQLCSSMYTIMP